MMLRSFTSRACARARVPRALLCVAAGAFAIGCSNDATGAAARQEVDGPAVTVGNGTARMFAIERGGTPVSLGIELSNSALAGLPDTLAQWMLALPTGVTARPWDHAMINWNPQGHPPPHVYDLPHFDFHFYAIPMDQQMAIPGGPDTTTVTAQFVPQDYASEVESVPAMGVHWADTLAPEFHGSTFDKTFIYGFFHGQMVFVEPMVTTAYLATHPDVEAPVKQPAAFQQSGMYPKAYGIQWDDANQSIRLTLDSLASH